MDNDIVETLHGLAAIVDETKETARLTMINGDLFTEAANEIERLRSENERLSESLSNALRLLAARKETRRG